MVSWLPGWRVLSPQALLRAADAARDRGDWVPAAKLYSRYLRRNTADARIWIQAGHAEKESGNLKAARDAYQRGHLLLPDDPDANLQLGRLLRHLGEYQAALRCHQVALIGPATGPADWRTLADLARDAREWNAAARYYARYLECCPDDAAIHVQLGHAEKEQGEFFKAHAAYERACSLAPACGDTLMQLAGLLLRQGDQVAALGVFRDALDADPALLEAEHAIAALAPPDPATAETMYPTAQDVEPAILDAIRPHFDPAFYLDANPDVAESGMNPLVHFHLQGWREGRNPSRGFDVAYYLTANSDVAAARMDPLLHWAWRDASRAGWRCGRWTPCARSWTAPRPPAARARGGAHRRIVPSRSGPVSCTMRWPMWRAWCSRSVTTTTPATAAACRTLSATSSARRRCWLGHPSPLGGGALPHLADTAHGQPLLLRLNGVRLGVAGMDDVLAAVRRLRIQDVSMRVVIHHLMGHSPEGMLDLIVASGDPAPAIWVHDFFSVCPSYTLMRNDVVHCGGPPPDSVACTLCCYGAERVQHQTRMRAFFDAAQPVVLAPSETALTLWRARAGLPHAAAFVQPPADLRLDRAGAAPGNAGGRLRIAHLGRRVFHKGWPVFEELAIRFANDSRYEFLQLGAADDDAPMPGCVRHLPVQVAPDRRDAMTDAVRDAGVDVVVAWSMWPETFCFTAHEALAGGAYVVARQGAGNIWPAVERNAPDQGCAVADQDALFALFAGAALTASAAKPRREGAVLPGGGSMAWLARTAGPMPAPPVRV